MDLRDSIIDGEEPRRDGKTYQHWYHLFPRAGSWRTAAGPWGGRRRWKLQRRRWDGGLRWSARARSIYPAPCSRSTAVGFLYRRSRQPACLGRRRVPVIGEFDPVVATGVCDEV